MTRITAPSRLHFGLLHVPAGGADRWPGPEPGSPGVSVRAFGGVGLMVQSPGAVVTVQKASSWQFEGPLASRAMVFARRFVAAMTDAETQAFQVLVERCPAQHVGFGTGTQLAMAVGEALATEIGIRPLPAAELARRVGRGERSAVGVHGFRSGGLIVEGGKRTADGIAPLLGRYRLPAEWRVVVFYPDGGGEWTGDRERAAFARPRSADDMRAATEAMSRLVLGGIVPAVLENDPESFGEAVHEYNLRAGLVFAAEQGGVYANAEVEALVRFVRGLGVPGVAQSSWGPGVFAVLPDRNQAGWVRDQVRARFPALTAFVTTPFQPGEVRE